MSSSSDFKAECRSLNNAGACGQLVVEQGGAGCGGQSAGKAADIEELGKRVANVTTAVA